MPEWNTSNSLDQYHQDKVCYYTGKSPDGGDLAELGLK